MTLREQQLEVRENYPEFWQWLDDMCCMCPVGAEELDENERDERCFGGCKLCWDDYIHRPERWYLRE